MSGPVLNVPNGTTATVTSSTMTSITTSVPNGATTGPISVIVSGQTVTSATNFIVSGAEAEEEPNDSLSSAQTITAPATVNGTISGSNDDWYKITPPTGNTYTITVTCDNTTDVDLWVYDSLGNTLAINTLEGTGGATAKFYTFFDDLTYYIKVEPWAVQGTKSYTLTVQQQ